MRLYYQYEFISTDPWDRLPASTPSANVAPVTYPGGSEFDPFEIIGYIVIIPFRA